MTATLKDLCYYVTKTEATYEIWHLIDLIKAKSDYHIITLKLLFGEIAEVYKNRFMTVKKINAARKVQTVKEEYCKQRKLAKSFTATVGFFEPHMQPRGMKEDSMWRKLKVPKCVYCHF